MFQWKHWAADTPPLAVSLEDCMVWENSPPLPLPFSFNVPACCAADDMQGGLEKKNRHFCELGVKDTWPPTYLLARLSPGVDSPASVRDRGLAAAQGS